MRHAPGSEWRIPGALSIEVTIGESRLVAAPGRLIATALGSCVGVAIHDPVAKRGALAHVMLPSSSKRGYSVRPGRFADWAIPELVRRLEGAGCDRSRLIAKLAGGATMFAIPKDKQPIGERNVLESRHQLELMSIPLIAEDIGGQHARTIEFLPESGELVVRTLLHGDLRL